MKNLVKHLLLALVLAVALCANEVSAAPIKVRIGTLAPKGSSYTKHLQAMGEEWRQASNGGILLTIYPDSTMGSEAEMVRRMRLGQLQGAMVTATGLSEIEPGAAGLQNMPRAFRSLDEVDYVCDKLEPMLEKRLEEKGFVVLFWSDTGFVRMFSKQPIVTPDDLRKTKLFVSGNRPSELEIYRSVGCTPVPLEFADILPSMQTGLIDAVALPPTIALATQLDATAPCMLDMNWVPLVGAAIVTKKTWDSFPPETQQALRAAAHKAGNLIKADGRRESVESIDAMRKRGLKVQTPTPEASAQWDDLVEKATSKIRGSVVPVDIYDEVMSQLKTYRAAQEGPKK